MPLAEPSKEVVEIQLPTEGEWVKVLKTLGATHKQEIATRTAARVRFLGLPFSETDPIVIQEASYATLSVVIREWGWKQPITMETVRGLDDDSTTAIFARMGELYPADRTEDERKNSSGDGAEPSSAAAPSQTSSAG